jgi:hypothetical protein
MRALEIQGACALSVSVDDPIRRLEALCFVLDNFGGALIFVKRRKKNVTPGARMSRWSKQG